MEKTATDRIIAYATVVIMVATTAYAIIALLQWNAMEKQNIVAFQQLSIAKDSIGIANQALIDARESGNEQSARAKKSLDATINNFHLEQRAWVGVLDMSDPGYTEGERKVYVKEGQPIKGDMIIVNTGKTPALNVQNTGFITYLPIWDNLNKRQNVVLQMEPSKTVIQPGGKIYLQLNCPSFPLKLLLKKL